MGRYRISIDAQADLIRIYHYGAIQFGEVQAERYFLTLIAKFEAIAQNPMHYQAVNDVKPKYRRCAHKSNTIYFRVLPDMVEIMAITGRQDIKSIK